MDTLDILKDKRVLLVDDEPDILETLEELLDTCCIDTAKTYEDAISLLRENTYDAAVLDIMGVKGYDLLKVTSRFDIPSLMLTAHALTPDNLKQSIDRGADAYVPKDKLVDIAVYVADVLERKAGRKKTTSWFSQLRPVFDKLFGEGWHKKEKDFWDEFDRKETASPDDT